MVAEVIADISNSEIDRIFDYEIGSLEIGAGFRVLVPFGRFETEGYVVAVKEKSEYPNLKPIIRALDDKAVISEEMLALMDYMTDGTTCAKRTYYGCLFPLRCAAAG